MWKSFQQQRRQLIGVAGRCPFCQARSQAAVYRSHRNRAGKRSRAKSEAPAMISTWGVICQPSLGHVVWVYYLSSYQRVQSNVDD
jgi:hypothetical protein